MIPACTAVARMLAVAMLMAVAGTAVAQQVYPSKPMRIIVPNPPGGGPNLMARLIGQKFTESWGQPVVVDNRPGGNGYLAGIALAKSAPDAHTMMAMTSTHIITPLLIPAPYDPIKDFTPVATLAKAELILVAHPSVPASTLQELLALAKLKPGQFNRGSPGEGSPARLVGSLFDIMTGTSMQNVSYKGVAQILVDLLSGQIQFTFALPTAVMPHLSAGKLKAIAISGETRFPALPQVPTFTEAGLPGFEGRSWYGMLAPAGTPRQIIDKLSAEIARVMAAPDFKDKLAGQGFDPFVTTPEHFTALMRADTDKFARVIKAANIKLEQ